MTTVRTRSILACAAALGCLETLGCADYIARTEPVRRAYQSYDFDAALAELPKADDAGVDQLLALLDRGMILHAAGRWKESIAALAAAEKLTAEWDAISISEEAGTLVGNERSRHYRGEGFEHLLIGVVQALNYLMLDDRDGALVEVRRTYERLRRLGREDGKPWQDLGIAHLVGGLLQEDDGELDAAFIDYRDALRAEPHLTLLAGPLLRLAKQTGRLQELDELKARFPGQEVPAPLGGDGELWVIVEAGLAPQKRPASSRHNSNDSAMVQLPVFETRGLPNTAVVEADGRRLVVELATSVEKVALENLNARMSELLTRALASTAIKAGIAGAAGAASKDSNVGWLVFFALTLTNQADLRSWMSLPNEFQVAVARLPAGKHTVTIDAQGFLTTHEVELRAKHVEVVVVRRY